ncbi:RPII140-upstream gene protein-like [Liolophura sinensis]|uniref:RPII140-upstream gene protein-like n=1 Tax=Liolophura sinensis TaxID=3198878 RepID=UPI0031592A85
MDKHRDGIYYKLLSAKSQGIFGTSRHDATSRLSSYLTYCRLRSFLRLPVVYAEIPSATDVIEKRMATQNVKSKAIVTEADVHAYLLKETGRDRLKEMFTRTENGRYSTEIENIGITITNACGCAFVFSSIISSRRARDEFLDKNKLTVFTTRFKAARLMNDRIILTVLKDGAWWALKLGCFLLPFLLVSQSIAVYRNKSSPFEYAAGSFFSGCMIKMNLGLKASLAGGVIGSVMGLGAGLAIYGMMYASGELQEDRHFREIQALLETQKEHEIMFTSVIPQPS